MTAPASTPTVTILRNGIPEPFFTPTTRQLEALQCGVPNLLLWGPRGTAKSTWLRNEAHARALATPNFPYAIIRKTHPDLLKTHLLFIEAEMRKLGGTFNKTDRIAKYPNGSRGFYAHAGNEDVSNLLGAELYWLGVDELPEIEWETFAKLAASVRVPLGSGLIAMVRACGNPFGISAEEMRRYFIDKDITPEEDPDYIAAQWHAIFTTLADNPHLDAEQYRRSLGGRGLPVHLRKAWIDGEFFTEHALFEIRPHHWIEQMPTIGGRDLLAHDWVRIYRAYDHGFYPDPAVCLWFAVVGEQVIVFKERTWTRTVAKEIAREILAESAGMRIAATYCDPSIDLHTGADVQSIKDIMEIEGLPLDPSVNNREHFASAIHSGLAATTSTGSPRLQILRPACPYLAKTLPKMRYDPRDPLKLAHHKDDHAAVALAYFLMSYAGAHLTTAEAAPRVIRPWMRPKPGSRRVLGSEAVRHR